MIFYKTALEKVYLIEPNVHQDTRGLFARMFCAEIFKAHGLATDYPQCNLSVNKKRGTIRGLHFQKEPHAEDKLIFCTKGKLFDVIVDLRTDSPTYGRWYATILQTDMHRFLYIPKGCAHGFQTLVDDTEVLYHMSHPYRADHASGILWNSPSLGISWPIKDALSLSDRDQAWPEFIQ